MVELAFKVRIFPDLYLDVLEEGKEYKRLVTGPQDREYTITMYREGDALVLSTGDEIPWHNVVRYRRA
jgi:hypothetical protein